MRKKWEIWGKSEKSVRKSEKCDIKWETWDKVKFMRKSEKSVKKVRCVRKEWVKCEKELEML